MGLSAHLHTMAPSSSALAMVQLSPSGVSPLPGTLREDTAHTACPSPRIPPQDPKTTWGHHIPAPVPGSSPGKVSPGGQRVSQQWHRALWEGSSALCQLGGEGRGWGQSLHPKTHMVPCQQVPPALKVLPTAEGSFVSHHRLPDSSAPRGTHQSWDVQ